jgi:hypothetical protein
LSGDEIKQLSQKPGRLSQLSNSKKVRSPGRYKPAAKPDIVRPKIRLDHATQQGAILDSLGEDALSTQETLQPNGARTSGR